MSSRVALLFGCSYATSSRQHLDEAVAVGQLVAIERGAPAQHLLALGGLADDGAAVAQDPVELVPLRRARQRLLERVARPTRIRIDADGAAEVVDARRIVAGREPTLAELHEQLAGLVAPRALIDALAEAGHRVDLGERLGELERLRVELAAFLEVVGRGLEVLLLEREPAELETDLRLAVLVAGLPEDLELGLPELADHRVVAERARRAGAQRRAPRCAAARASTPAASATARDRRGRGDRSTGPPRAGDGSRAARLCSFLRRVLLRELGQLALEDLDRGRRIVRLDDLEQPIRSSIVGRIELERGAQVLDRGRGLAEHDHRLAGLAPRVGGAHRIALVLGPGRAQLGEQLAASGIAKLLAKGREPLGLGLLPEDDNLRLQRIDLASGQRVVGHPRLPVTISRDHVRDSPVTPYNRTVSRVQALSLVALAACSSPSGGDVVGPFTGTTQRYVVDRMTLPTSSNQAMAFADDLDGDGKLDNQLGTVFSALTSTGDATTHIADI